MTVYVLRGGVLVPKGSDRAVLNLSNRSDFPAPMLSHMDPFESPVTGREVSSWRDRDRDMAAAGAVDPRDLAPPSRGRKKEEDHGRRTATDSTAFEWGRLTSDG